MSPASALFNRAQAFSFPGAPSSRLPSSWILLWELPFWFIFIFGSLVPATMIPKDEWFGIPMKVSDAITLVSAAFYGTAGLIRFVLKPGISGAATIVMATLAMFGYGSLRLIGGPLEAEDLLAMGFALMLAASAPIQAAGILSMYSPVETKGFINRLVVFVALVSLVYTAESVFGLGLRSEASINLNSDFGIQRVRGPLYGSSTGYLLLLPALGWAIGSFFDENRKKSYAVLTTTILFSAYLGLGSRAALILLVVFMISNLIMLRRSKRSEATGFVLAGFCVCMGFLIYAQADTQRLTQFEDTHRRLTHETAANILVTEPVAASLLGQGYGAIWPWYRRDTLRTESIAHGDNIIATGFGASLYHSHSTLLELVIEFGLIGVCWLLFILIRTARLPLTKQASTSWRVFALAVLVSFCSFGFDLFIFKEVRVNSVWWIFLIASYQLPRATEMNEI